MRTYLGVLFQCLITVALKVHLSLFKPKKRYSFWD